MIDWVRRSRDPRSDLNASDIAELRRAFDDASRRRGGEVSAERRAAVLAATYRRLSVDGRREYLLLLANEFGIDPAAASSGAALLSTSAPTSFLELKRITWNSPAALLERLARSEAVHVVADWVDLKNRLDRADRRVFAFFHPRMPQEPLIFVHAALTRGPPAEIGPILDPASLPLDPSRADTVTSYSISSVQPGLAGISLGGFLIKRVVDTLATEFGEDKRFATLSPVRGFRRWAEDADHSASDHRVLCAVYLLREKHADGRARDPVANFHFSNGARLERINLDADHSPRGITESYGIMVNYVYARNEIAANHDSYATDRVVAASTVVSRLVQAAGRPRRLRQRRRQRVR
jgi:malonyl-CoA decarboxylase